MIEFVKPINLNGKELRNELRNSGVEISDDPLSVRDNADGKLLLDIADNYKDIAETVVKLHNGTVLAVEPTPTEKLAAAGLTVDELKAVLGIN